MAQAYFIFNGKRSSDFGLFIQKHTSYPIPRRTYDPQQVTGSNQFLSMDSGTYEPLELEFHCTIEPKQGESVEEVARKISRWLRPDGGVQNLYFSKDADVRYRAVANEVVTIDTSLGVFGEAVISFLCDPRRFLLSGEKWLGSFYPVRLQLRNMGDGESYPLIKLGQNTDHGDYGIAITKDGLKKKYLFGHSNNSALYIDSENLLVYNDKNEEVFSLAKFWDFPKFPKGDFELEGIALLQVSILPRWWRL